MEHNITFGFPRLHLEAGERRDFLPEFIGELERDGAEVFLEHGYGAGMGLGEADYRDKAPGVRFVSNAEAYRQDVVVVLRYTRDELIKTMRPGACLVSMLHYPTRPARVAFLSGLGIEAISLDSLKDDVGRRLVENLRSVGWNGVKVAFQVLAEHFPPPGLADPNRNPIKVTVLGAGAVGMYAIQAAIHYGDDQTWKRMADIGATGVQVTVVDYDLTNHPRIMQKIVEYTDILVDATQRVDPSQPVIPNEWIGIMRPHAVLLDLAVDPYTCGSGILSVKGIEGVPHGNLDQYIFAPDDPVYETLPRCVQTTHRRYAVSCYSWPGIYPKECMLIYGHQLHPFLQAIIEAGGVKGVLRRHGYFHRALKRALLSRQDLRAADGNGQKIALDDQRSSAG